MVSKVFKMAVRPRRPSSKFDQQEFANIASNDYLSQQYENEENCERLQRSSNDGSINSSYADLFEASGVIIRDYEGSFSRGNLYSNPITYNLKKCKMKVVVPYYRLLCLVAWRPLGNIFCCPQFLVDLWNTFYTVFFFGVLLFWYFIRVYTCQGSLMLDQSKAVPSPAPTHGPLPTFPPNVTEFNWTDTIPSERVLNFSKLNRGSQPFLDPCQHVFGTYIVPSILHFLAFVIGFYHFRIKDYEGLYVLMEQVCLQSRTPDKISTRLRLYLWVGLAWLLFNALNSSFYFFAFGFERGTAISTHEEWPKYAMACVIVLAGTFALCVNLAVVLSYCGQCQLLKYYINGVRERLEEKSTDLKQAMKEILDIKRHFNRLNGSLSFSLSCIVFDLMLVVAITTILLFNYRGTETRIWWYRVLVNLLWGSMLVFVLIQAASLTSTSQELKQKVLTIRVFGYQTYSQLDIDSFLNFLHMMELQAEIFTIPVKPRYLFGSLILAVQVLILVFQTGSVITNSKWI